MAITCVGNHQRLHRHTVFLHQIRDAGIGVDDDLVGETHQPTLIVALHVHKMFAEGPVVVANGHADGRVGVHHLIGTDNLYLVRIGVEAERVRDSADLAIVGLDQLEGPVAAFRQKLGRLLAHAASFL